MPDNPTTHPTYLIIYHATFKLTPTLQVLWHPHEASKVATAGWDGVVKFWD